MDENPITQTKEDVIELVKEVRNIRRNLLSPLPFTIQQAIEFELESYGYDLIVNYALTNCINDIKYLTKCLTNHRQKLLGRYGKQLQRYRSLNDDIAYDVDSDQPSNDNLFDRLYMSSLSLPKHHKEHIYWVVVMIARGSHRPIQDAAEQLGVSRMTVSRALRQWKDNYAKEIKREVRQVRSIKHLQKLLYWGARQ